MRRILPFGLLAVAVSGAVLWLGARFTNLSGWLTGDEAIFVHAAPVQLQRRSVSLRVSGKLSAETFEVRSRIAGRVAEVRFEVGDFAPPGAVVAIIAPSRLAQIVAELEAGVSAAQEALKAKQERLNDAQKDLERNQDFARKNLIARSDVESAAAALETARAEAELAEAHVAQQKAMLDQARGLRKFTRVTTEAGGFVMSRFVNAGAAVGEGSPILSISDMATLRMKGAISPKVADAIKIGLTVQILPAGAAERKIYPGKVLGIEQVGGQPRQSALIEISVDAQGAALKPETPSQALIDFERESIWLPNTAVVTENGSHYVYKLLGERTRRHEVTLGITQVDEVEVAAGLEKGDWVIVDAGNSLKSRTRVRVQNSRSTENRSKRERLVR